MNRKFLNAACIAALCASPAIAQDMKGKMKEGLYEVKLDMEMPGMPAGMGKQSMTMQNCVTAKDLESGRIGQRPDEKPGDCEVKDFKMSGNTATYKTVCKGQTQMTADTSMTFRGDGYTMNTKVAMNQGGQVMNMTQKMEGRYIGPCKK